MRTKAIAALLAVVSVFFSDCNRPSDSGEVQRLREEVERLKSAQRSVPPVATPAAESPEYQNFLRVARRLVTAIESGLSFQEFHQRAVDVLASAKEASRSAPTPTKQKAIATFAIAITDAHDIWNYKVANNALKLSYSKDKSGRLTRDITEGIFQPCGRWDYELPTLVAAYDLTYFDFGSSGMVRIDSAIEHIFKVCVDTFKTLEAPK